MEIQKTIKLSDYEIKKIVLGLVYPNVTELKNSPIKKIVSIIPNYEGDILNFSLSITFEEGK